MGVGSVTASLHNRDSANPWIYWKIGNVGNGKLKDGNRKYMSVATIAGIIALSPTLGS